MRVWPGPDWEASGFGDQDVVVGSNGVAAHVLGITRRPDEATLRLWAKYVLEAADAGCPLDGGWAPHRSLVVEWGAELYRPGVGPKFWYKSNDNGMHDLCYAPAQDPIKPKEAFDEMIRAFGDWKHLVAKEFADYKKAHGRWHIKTRAVAGALADYMQDAQNEIDNMRQAAQEDDQVLDPAWEAGAFVKPFPISMILREAPGIDVTKVPADQKINKPIFF